MTKTTKTERGLRKLWRWAEQEDKGTGDRWEVASLIATHVASAIGDACDDAGVASPASAIDAWKTAGDLALMRALTTIVESNKPAPHCPTEYGDDYDRVVREDDRPYHQRW